MFIGFSLLLVFASYKIANCENSDLPQVFIPNRKIFVPQNPPKLPSIYLAGQRFTLPQFCRNASEWEDVDLSIKILADATEEPERSAFASLVNLIKFILIKEELPCLNAMTGPVSQVKRPEGQIFDLGSKQISRNIETALANKPKHRSPAVDFYDNIDISNLIPIWRSRGNRRRNQEKNPTNGTKIDCACKTGPKVLQNLGSGITIVGANLSPITKGAKASCNCPTLTLNVQPKPPSCNMQCQTLPSTNIKPVILGCGPNCNICQKLSNPDCPKLASAAVLTGCGCPKANMVVGGCPCSKPVVGCPCSQPVVGCPCSQPVVGCPCSQPVLGCPKCSADMLPVSPCQTKQAVTVYQSEAVPMVNCFGNLVKKVTTTVLMPY